MAVLHLLLPLLLAAPLIHRPTDAVPTLRKLPSFVRKCSVKDPKLEICAVESGREVLPHIVKGDPALRLPSLDPLSVTEIHIQTGNEPNFFNMTCRNIVITGLADTYLIRHSIDLKNQIYGVTCSIPRLEILSDYTVDGRILVLPIKGNGKANFTFENAIMYYEQKYTLEKRGEYQFHKFPSSFAKFNCTRAHFHLENLFDGDKQLGNTVNTFLNENWSAVLDDLGQPVVDAAAEVIRQFAIAIVDNIPYSYIFDDVE